ncbi:DUF6114 domain-containing protein [Halorientalis regularis]|jgi:hypothetical protein|uniref:Uncharacterized protein n=1 Tax=Halorientalis regularis TaxID=660518 RepID=A0A1G7RGF4_9EURY|nr:DUF6114 domain-containing protein [Halorientalis regularis]SDG09916.1 hypothetical protein SAMN05216218_11525 [Halorientalis regularis]
MNEDRVAAARERWVAFGEWRRQRPFWGGVLLLVAGLLTAYLPAAYDEFLLFAAGSFTGSALLFGGSLVVCGLLVFAVPSLSSVLGGLGILVATVSLFGALGGFVVGSVLGGLGGILAFAWTAPDERDSSDDR